MTALPPVVDAGTWQRELGALRVREKAATRELIVYSHMWFAVNVFLRDGDTVYRTWHTNGRGTEQLTHTFALIDLLAYGRQEERQDSPEGWPQAPTYSGWGGSQRVAALYGPDA